MRNWIGYDRGSALEQDQYVDWCIGALDDVMDWDPDGTIALTGTLERPEEMTPIAECISPICNECDIRFGDMDEQQRAHHRVYRGMILVCCEGYWMINPRALGLPDEIGKNWQDWTKVSDDDIAEATHEDGGRAHFEGKYGTKEEIEDRMRGIESEWDEGEGDD